MRLNHLFAGMLCFFLLSVQSCTGHAKNNISRGGQSEPCPHFTSVSWPAPYSILPEGRLVITGNLQCPAGYFEEMPIDVSMYPVAFIEPPLALSLNPPPSHQALQAALEANPKVQELILIARTDLLRRVTEGPFNDKESLDDYTKGLASHAIFSEAFDEYNYVNFQTGDFRIDFDQTARLTPGDTLLMVEGIDALGSICIEMNIFSIADLAPESLAELDAASIAHAQRLVGLGNAVIQVLRVSGDNRTIDIALLQPFLPFINEAYGDGYHKWDWDSAVIHLRAATDAASTGISNPTVRLFYKTVVNAFCHFYEFSNFKYWISHFVEIPPGMDLLEKNEEAVDYTISQLTEFQEQYIVTVRGGGALEVTIIINQSNELAAQFSIIADPHAALVVVGFIGEHNITVEDYNPYVIELLKIFEDEGIPWPPAVTV